MLIHIAGIVGQYRSLPAPKLVGLGQGKRRGPVAYLPLGIPQRARQTKVDVVGIGAHGGEINRPVPGKQAVEELA